LVSYYTIADVTNKRLTTPSKDPRFQYITPCADLITKQNIRIPIDEEETIDGTDHKGAYISPDGGSGYDMIYLWSISLPDPSL
jgi:hypothetical protein